MPDGTNPHPYRPLRAPPLAITAVLGAVVLVAISPAAAQREREVKTCRDEYRDCWSRPYRDHRRFLNEERRWDERRDEHRLREELEWSRRRELRRERQW